MRLKPNQRRTVRLRMTALPADMPEGESCVFMVSLSPKRKTYRKSTCRERLKSNDGSALNLTSHINSYVPVYVQKENQYKTLNITVMIKALRFVMTVTDSMPN
ncbi:hypothetical protein O9992_17655 [Vibrio lentus]|nr:hypothetical protein [Vibrio lentus]